MDNETEIIFKYEEIIRDVFDKRLPASVALKQILIDFKHEINSVNPPKSKFMKKYYESRCGEVTPLYLTDLAELIDKYKEDK